MVSMLLDDDDNDCSTLSGRELGLPVNHIRGKRRGQRGRVDSGSTNIGGVLPVAELVVHMNYGQYSFRFVQTTAGNCELTYYCLLYCVFDHFVADPNG